MLPDDGPAGPKHVGVIFRLTQCEDMCFDVKDV